MILTLRAVSLNDNPLTQPITAQFDSRGGTIGRADHNTLALPDPERHISRQQAEIRADGAGGFLIMNVGSANPITVGGQPIAQGQSVPLRARDQVRVGGYLLEVSEEAGGAEAATVVRRAPEMAGVRPAPATTSAAALAADPFASLSASGNPFADLLGPSSASPAPAQSRAPSPSPFAQAYTAPAPAPKASAGPARLPDDFDPFAPPPAPAPVAAAAPSFFDAPAPKPAAASSDPFADLMPAEPSRSLDDLFGLSGGGGGNADPLAGFMAGATTRGGDTLPTDPLALFGDQPATAVMEPAAPAMADHTSALQSSFRPPEARRPTPRQEPAIAVPAHVPDPIEALLGGPIDAAAPAPPVRPSPPPAAPMQPQRQPQSPVATPTPMAAPPAASAPSADTAALWRAFCEGAGMRHDPAQPLTPELMKVIGQVLNSAVDGTLRMMAVRAATKHELRAQVTVIRSRDNNPLKFSPDAESALEQLLQPAVRGFLPGPAAMSDAMHDLVGHTIGSMAGTRAALEGVLARFQPASLESKLTSRSMLDSVLTLNRKAKLWELYLQHFESIREEAQEDFHTLFGKAFLEAYEDQLERLNDRQGVA